VLEHVARLLGVGVRGIPDPHVPLSVSGRAPSAGSHDLRPANGMRVVSAAISMRLVGSRASLLAAAALRPGHPERLQRKAPTSLLGVRIAQPACLVAPVAASKVAEPASRPAVLEDVRPVLWLRLIVREFSSAVSRVVGAAQPQGVGWPRTVGDLAGVGAHGVILYGKARY
jgi:hypothetical protein